MYYNNPMGNGLDRHITGNYGEDQFPRKKKRPSKKKKERDADDGKGDNNLLNKEKGE